MNYSFVKPVLFGARLATRWKNHTTQQNAVWIKKELVHMGPAYVKIGQLVASRNDVFPQEVVDELSSLHDNVPPCSYEDIRQVVEYELTKNIDDIFIEFSTTSLNSASIGQVHSAVLREFPDKPIVVKVQRPNIEHEFARDFDSIIFFTKFITQIAPNNKELDDLYNVIVQSRKMIEDELDFTKEYENLRMMRNAFKNDKNVVIPRTIKHLSTKRILLMEFVESSKLVTSSNPNEITRQMVKSVVTGALRHGLIHGDLHPGNVGFISSDSEPGKIVLYDCGLVLQVDKTVVRNLFTSVLTNDVQLLFDTLVQYKLVYIDNDKTGVYQLKRMIIHVFKYVNTLNVKQFASDIALDPALNNGRLDFHIAPDLFLVSRTITLLEGTCKTVDESFMYTDIILDMISDLSVVSEYLDVDVLWTKSLIDIGRLTRNETDTGNDDTGIMEYMLLKKERDLNGNKQSYWIFFITSIIIALNI